jgi:hypothetical protein
MIGTKEAARILGVRPGTLLKSIWESRLPEPIRGPGKAFIWSNDDLRRASWLLRRKDLDAVLAERRTTVDEEPRHV